MQALGGEEVAATGGDKVQPIKHPHTADCESAASTELSNASETQS